MIFIHIFHSYKVTGADTVLLHLQDYFGTKNPDLGTKRRAVCYFFNFPILHLVLSLKCY